MDGPCVTNFWSRHRVSACNLQFDAERDQAHPEEKLRKVNSAEPTALRRLHKSTASGEPAGNRKLTLHAPSSRIESKSMQDKPLEIERVDEFPGTTVLRIHGP